MVVIFNPPHLWEGQPLGTSFSHLVTQPTPLGLQMIGGGWQPMHRLAKAHDNVLI